MNASKVSVKSKSKLNEAQRQIIAKRRLKSAQHKQEIDHGAANLKSGSESAISTDLGDERSQNGVDCGQKCAGEAVGDDELGQRGHDEDGGLWLHLL